jgi:CelD/BcsL family acetyltransferase involved in cellulose biosynthesis
VGAGVRIVRDLEAEVWRAALLGLPGASVFHTPEMFRVFAHTRGHRPECWAAVRGDEILALFTPVRIALRDGLGRYLTTRSVAYAGPIRVPGPDGEAALGALLDAYEASRDRAVLFTEVRHLVEPAASSAALRNHGFAFEEHLNYLVDIAKPVEEVLAQIRQRTRKQIRQGLRKGVVTVERCDRAEDVAIVQDLLRTTYARARVPGPDPTLLQAAFDVLHPAGMAIFVLARVEGEPAAASVELPWGDVVYGWYGGVDRRFVKHLPGELLMWHVLSWGAEHGFRTYDFGGAGRPGEEYGVRDFKAKFGGELVAFGRHVRVHAPARMRVATAGYGLARRLGRFTG